MNYEYLVPITTALLEVVKQAYPVPSRYLPLLSVIVGSSLGVYFGFDVLQSILIGLAASGLYKLGKAPVTTTVTTLRKKLK